MMKMEKITNGTGRGIVLGGTVHSLIMWCHTLHLSSTSYYFPPCTFFVFQTLSASAPALLAFIPISSTATT